MNLDLGNLIAFVIANFGLCALLIESPSGRVSKVVRFPVVVLMGDDFADALFKCYRCLGFWSGCGLWFAFGRFDLVAWTQVFHPIPFVVAIAAVVANAVLAGLIGSGSGWAIGRTVLAQEAIDDDFNRPSFFAVPTLENTKDDDAERSN